MDNKLLTQEQHEKHLDDMDQFFETHELPNLSQEEII